MWCDLTGVTLAGIRKHKTRFCHLVLLPWRHITQQWRKHARTCHFPATHLNLWSVRFQCSVHHGQHMVFDVVLRSLVQEKVHILQEYQHHLWKDSEKMVTPYSSKSRQKRNVWTAQYPRMRTGTECIPELALVSWTTESILEEYVSRTLVLWLVPRGG